jgi:hypothetical protein
MPEIFAFWPAWLSLTVAAIVGFNYLIAESYKFAAFFGKWGKALHKRAMRRHRIDLISEEFAQAVSHAVELARDKWESEGNEALEALTGQLKTVSRITEDQKRLLDELLFKVRCMTVYTEYEALWHSRLRSMTAASVDDHIPIAMLAKHIDYYQFEVLYRANPNWQTWDGV